MPVALNLVELLQIRKLIYAVGTGNFFLVNKLVEKGVKNLINYNDPETGMTPLIAAVTKGNTKMLDCLLKLNAHPDVIDFSGRTALMYAAELGNVTTLQLLRTAEADARLQDFEGKDALFYSFHEPTPQHNRCFKMLLEMEANVNNRTRDGVPNLVYICNESKDYDTICLDLIRAGADINLVDEATKRTALHNACLSGSSKVVRELLRVNADPNVLDNRQSTPAHEAAKGGHLLIVQILSAYGAKFDVYDCVGNNPMHYAVLCRTDSVVRFLAQRGCNPKSKNVDGYMPKTISTRCKTGPARTNMRKAERSFHEMTMHLDTESHEFRDWRLLLYDYIYEHRERIGKILESYDTSEPKNGFITTEDFKQFLEKEPYVSFLTPEHIKDICFKHEKVRNEFDYKAFLNGSKYLKKTYLMPAFDRKKKKKSN